MPLVPTPVITKRQKRNAINCKKTNITKKRFKENEEEGEAKGISIQRYKGLGEMNPDQLWETTMDPKTRMMKKVMIDSAEEANETFEILMGADVAPRKHFIQTHAKYVKNLDI